MKIILLPLLARLIQSQIKGVQTKVIVAHADGSGGCYSDGYSSWDDVTANLTISWGSAKK